MNGHVITYPSLQRRLVIHRRHRALFLPRTTQHVTTKRLYLHEVARAVVAMLSLLAWSLSLLLIAG
jgi:hypothetical protein